MLGCAAEGTLVVEDEPPAPREEVVETRPGFIYVHGHWNREGGRWAWSQGRYEKERVGHTYVQGHWERREGRRRLQFRRHRGLVDQIDEREGAGLGSAERLDRSLAVGEGGLDVEDDGQRLRDVILEEGQQDDRGQGQDPVNHKEDGMEAAAALDRAEKVPLLV